MSGRGFRAKMQFGRVIENDHCHQGLPQRRLDAPDAARANIRRHVKRLFGKYGYPPDLQDAAVQNVLQQAETLSAEWVM